MTIITLVPFKLVNGLKSFLAPEAVVIVVSEDNSVSNARISATEKLLQKYDGVIGFVNKSEPL